MVNHFDGCGRRAEAAGAAPTKRRGRAAGLAVARTEAAAGDRLPDGGC